MFIGVGCLPGVLAVDECGVWHVVWSPYNVASLENVPAAPNFATAVQPDGGAGCACCHCASRGASTWSNPFADTLQAIIQFFDGWSDAANAMLWFDIFVDSQHVDAVPSKSPQWYIKRNYKEYCKMLGTVNMETSDCSRLADRVSIGIRGSVGFVQLSRMVFGVLEEWMEGQLRVQAASCEEAGDDAECME